MIFIQQIKTKRKIRREGSKVIQQLTMITNRLNWNVNKAITPKTLGESSDEQQKLVNYALKGIDI